MPKLVDINNDIIYNIHKTNFVSYTPIVINNKEWQHHYGKTGMNLLPSLPLEYNLIFRESNLRAFFIKKIVSKLDLSLFYPDIFKNLIFEDFIRHLDLYQSTIIKYKKLDYLNNTISLIIGMKFENLLKKYIHVTISEDNYKVNIFLNHTSQREMTTINFINKIGEGNLKDLYIGEYHAI